VPDTSLRNASVDELVTLALRFDPEESHEYWAPVYELYERGDRSTFEKARSLVIDGPGEPERILGIHILAQLGLREGRPFLEESLPLVEGFADPGQSARVLGAAVIALWHHGDRRSAPILLAHANHPDPEVRFAVAYALPSISDDPPPRAVLDALFALMEDTNSHVRYWATVGLGADLEVDTPEVRDALAARIGDGGKESAIEGEALRGLARRHDPRALEPVTRWLESRDPDPGELILEVAAALADNRCLPALYALREDWDTERYWLDAAIEACEGGATRPGRAV
jgi:HEAT repeat protein